MLPCMFRDLDPRSAGIFDLLVRVGAQILHDRTRQCWCIDLSWAVDPEWRGRNADLETGVHPSRERAAAELRMALISDPFDEQRMPGDLVRVVYPQDLDEEWVFRPDPSVDFVWPHRVGRNFDEPERWMVMQSSLMGEAWEQDWWYHETNSLWEARWMCLMVAGSVHQVR